MIRENGNRQLAASRPYFAFDGMVHWTLVLDGTEILKKGTLTRTGGYYWDSVKISRHHLWRGRHELEIRFARTSTTTYWIREVRVETEEG